MCAPIPFIIVSETPSEEGAIDSFKSGATDYVRKEHLSRLVPAVRRALHEVEAAAKCRRLETHLIEAQKMEAIGRPSSGMAHDFSNILAVIVGYNDLVTSGLDLATAPIRTNPSLPGTDPICVEDEAPAPVKPTKRILVVEDDISIRRLSTEMLIRSGYQVDAAADGAAGWKTLQGKSYDLVITDNFMPKVTGVEMVKKLHAAGMKLPVILATAMLPQEEFVAHPWLQAVTTLLKHFEQTIYCPQ